MARLTGRALLFDLDGVLIDSPTAHVKAWIRTFKPFGVDLKPKQLHLDEGKRSWDTGKEIVAKYGLDLDDSALRDLLQQKRQYYQTIAPHGMMDNAGKVVRLLRSAGWRLGLVSGSVRDNVEAALSADDLEFFEAIVTAEDYESGKPAPEPYLTAAKRLGIDETDCIAVENAPLGIASAKAAGMVVVALTSTLERSELAGADVIIDDLSELPGMLLLS